MDFPCGSIEPGVLYRKGLTAHDYDEAIEALQGAKNEDPAHGCGCCGDSDHTSAICHHNPLVMARRAVSKGNSWRCYHCNELFFTHEAAEEHFGRTQDQFAKCIESRAS